MKMIKLINNFLDRNFTMIEAIYIASSLMGFVWFIQKITKVNISFPLGLIFILIGIYGFIKNKKKKRKF